MVENVSIKFESSPQSDCEEEQEIPVINVMEGLELSDDAVSSDNHLKTDDDSSESEPIQPYEPLKRQFKLGSHIQINAGYPETYTCTICKCRFGLKKTARNHDYCATGKKPHKCKLCRKRFVTKWDLENHLRTHTGEKPFTCFYCDKKFSLRHKLKRHERIHTGEKGEVKCSQCGKLVFGQEALTKHIIKKHCVDREFTCLQCKVSYSDEEEYKAHQKLHTGKYICEHCGKLFKKSWNLSVHKRIHKGERPFVCGVCGSTFRLRQHLVRHCSRHEPDADFECTLCKATFRRKDNMIRHMKLNHPGRHVGIWTEEDKKAAKKAAMRSEKITGNSEESEENVDDPVPIVPTIIKDDKFPNIRFAKMEQVAHEGTSAVDEGTSSQQDQIVELPMNNSAQSSSRVTSVIRMNYASVSREPVIKQSWPS